MAILSPERERVIVSTGVERNDADFTERMPTANLTGGRRRRSARRQEPPVRLTRRDGIGGCPPEGRVKRGCEEL